MCQRTLQWYQGIPFAPFVFVPGRTLCTLCPPSTAPYANGVRYSVQTVTAPAGRLRHISRCSEVFLGLSCCFLTCTPGCGPPAPPPPSCLSFSLCVSPSLCVYPLAPSVGSRNQGTHYWQQCCGPRRGALMSSRWRNFVSWGRSEPARTQRESEGQCQPEPLTLSQLGERSGTP